MRTLRRRFSAFPSASLDDSPITLLRRRIVLEAAPLRLVSPAPEASPKTLSQPRIASEGFAPGPLAVGGRSQEGLTLVETLAVLIMAALLVSLSIPALDRAHQTAAMRSTAQEISGLLVRCRIRAIRNRRSTALVFERHDGAWRCFVAADGDGDGIRRADIASGTDTIVDQSFPLRTSPGGLGILAGERVPNPSGSGSLGGNLLDPVRAGRGDIITFTPTGTATPASIYLTDHREHMLALRILGSTGRVRTMVWRSGWESWKQSWY